MNFLVAVPLGAFANVCCNSPRDSCNIWYYLDSFDQRNLSKSTLRNYRTCCGDYVSVFYTACKLMGNNEVHAGKTLFSK